MAIRLVDSIDYDFSKFSLAARQDLALRTVAFDDSTHRYLSDHPKSTVIALGEGMQTSFWRLDAAGLGDEFRWLTVDLSTIIEIRERLLPAFATHLDMRPVRAGLQLDGSGGLPGWRVRHRRGPSALPAA